jgi:primosomal replication protein N
MAVGQTAQDMNSMHLGQRVRIRGFLASRSRLSSRLVLHVDQYELE